jgi:hypothetical protein
LPSLEPPSDFRWESLPSHRMPHFLVVPHARGFFAWTVWTLCCCLFASSVVVVAEDPRTSRSVEGFRRSMVLQGTTNVLVQEAAPPTLDGEEASSRVGSLPLPLIQPFRDVLSFTRTEIDMDKLLRACRKLKHTMECVGQDANAADLARNIQKVQDLQASAPRGRRETLRSLLQFEKETGIHGRNAALKDPSGAVGLLWIRRSLAFQHRMYSLVLNKNQPPTEAAFQAYKETLEPYHGWALQQIYTVGLHTTTPPRDEMLQNLSGCRSKEQFGVDEEKKTVRDLQKLLEAWQPVRRAVPFLAPLCCCCLYCSLATHTCPDTSPVDC